MTRLTVTQAVDADGLVGLRTPRRDFLIEAEAGNDVWEMTEGPFLRYRRSLQIEVEPVGSETGRVVETTDFSLAVPLWRPLITPLMKRGLRSTEREPRRRWWWPREIVARRTALLVSALCVISVMTGYLGVVISQTITFAAEDFGNDDSATANTLAAVRVGVLLSFVFIHRADRIGRRPLILGFAVGAILFTVMGAIANSLVVLGAFQTVSRGLTTGLITLLFLAATEEVPATVRAFSVSLVTICAALGAGMVVWVLPINDLIDGGWRVVYVAPVLFLPLLWWIAKHLPETRRFDAAATTEAPASINWRRFALIGGGAFASSLFFSPASQLRNEFLRDDLGYSATSISLFQIVVSAPAGTAVLLAGIAADRFGRRAIGATGLAVGATMMALSYQLGGAALWFAASAGIVLTGAAFPATRGYQTELFPTRARARVGGLIDVVAVTGSAIGLVTVGYLSERWNDLGSAIGVMVFAPLIVAVAIITLFPETASTELETFNPDDPDLDPVSEPTGRSS